MKKMTLALTTVVIASLFSGCIRMEMYDECDDPIYISYEKLRSSYPAIQAPREIAKAGKIYVYGDILLVNEKNKGIHVVDNSNREKPKNIHFIEIPGNIDMAVRDGYLYVDSFVDLVVLNIKDINNITKVHRKESVFPYDMEQALTKTDMNKNRCYADEKQGVVIGYK